MYFNMPFPSFLLLFSANLRRISQIISAKLAIFDKLDAGCLFSWHAALFPTGRSGIIYP